MEDIISSINKDLHQHTRAIASVERQGMKIYFSPEGFKKFKAHPGCQAVSDMNKDNIGNWTLLGMRVYVDPNQKEDYIIKRG